MKKKTIWDLDYQAIIKFAEEDRQRAVKEGEKYAVLRVREGSIKNKSRGE